MMSNAQRNAMMMEILKATDVVASWYERFLEAEAAFEETWGDEIPVNPEHGDFAATIRSIREGSVVVVVRFGELALVHAVEISSPIIRQLEPRDVLVVRDGRGATRSLSSLGILPCEDGSWEEDCLPLEDSIDSLVNGVGYLNAMETTSADTAASSLIRYIERVYGVQLTSSDEEDEVCASEDD